MNSLTPNLIVERIETCLPFWEELGFEKTTEVPHGDAIGFVILKRGPVEVMLQSAASIADDIPAIASEAFRSFLYVRTDDLDALRKLTGKAEQVMPERTTFYGAKELLLRDPTGNVVVFAQFES